MSDHLRIMCPALSCRKILAVPISSRGKNVRCKNCGATIRVPEKIPGAVPAPKPAAAETPGAPETPAKPAQAA